MNKEALLVEILLAGFFSIACFRARASNATKLRPQDLLYLTDRLERLRRTRWQWCAMVLLLVVVRLQLGTPLVAEITGLVQFIIFLALPSQSSPAGVLHRP